MSNAAAPATEGSDRTDGPSHVAVIMDGNGRWAKKRNLPRAAGHKAGVEAVRITVETCTHYLWFGAEDIPDGATEYKCAPPIRGAANREQLWRALGDGLIDMVTTDHSPCIPSMRRREEGQWNSRN